MNKVQKMRINWKFLAGIAVVVFVLSQFIPGLLATLPFLLFVVICPLMMFLMMPGTTGATGTMGMSHAEQGTPSNTKRRIASSLDVQTGVTHSWQRDKFDRRTLLAYLRHVGEQYPQAWRV